MREAGVVDNDIVTELKGLRPTDQTRSGDVVVRDMFGPGQHLLIALMLLALLCGPTQTCTSMLTMHLVQQPWTGNLTNSRGVTYKNLHNRFLGFLEGITFYCPLLSRMGVELGRMGDQGQALLLFLAERAVSSPPSCSPSVPHCTALAATYFCLAAYLSH